MSEEKKNENLNKHYLTWQEARKAVMADMLAHITAVENKLTPEDDAFPLGVSVLCGAKGLGKSRMVYKIAHEELADYFEGRIVTVRVSSRPEGELGGIPLVLQADKGNKMRYSLPDWFMEEWVDLWTVIFLDEFNRGQDGDSTTQMLHGLATERRLHCDTLPLKWVLVAAMNPADGSYNVQDLFNDESMRTRFKVYYLQDDLPEFLEWGDKIDPKTSHENIHKAIRAYLQNNPDDFSTQVNCPRTWHEASKDLYFLEDQNLTDELALTKFSASLDIDTARKLWISYTGGLTVLEPEMIIRMNEDDGKRIDEAINTGKHDALTNLVDTGFKRLLPEVLQTNVEQVAKFLKAIPPEIAYKFMRQLAEFASRAPDVWEGLYNELYTVVSESKDLRENLYYK